MAALIDAIDVKRKMFFEFEGTPFHCLDAEVNTPTARSGQTLVRLKMRNLLTHPDKLAGRFDIEPEDDWVPRYNIYPA
jgi:translation elongation factor P/translation initiation factor 5A